LAQVRGRAGHGPCGAKGPDPLWTMWWLVIPVGLYCFRKQIAQRLAPVLPTLEPQKAVFYGHLVTVFSTLLYIIPLELLGLSVVKRLAYMSSLWSVILTSMLAIKANYGAPPMPENLSFSNFRQVLTTTMQPWLEKALMGVDFHFLFFALIFVTAYPSVPALVILGRHRLWAVCTYCTKNNAQSRLWLMFAPTWAKLKAMEKQVLAYSALGEIALAFWLTVSLFLPTRQIIPCILYWNYLKTRYQVPRSHELHKQAWSSLGQKVEPVFKAVPILRKPIDMAKGWFAPQYQTR